jgi:putative transposase
MARAPRVEIVGLTYHVIAHGVDKLAIFKDDDDCDAILRFFADEVRRSSWTCLGDAVLRTHYHVLIELRKPSLSSGFHRLNTRYAQYFNHKYGRRGHVFEARFRSKIVESEAHRLEVARYIALNARRAGACQKPESYPWCDYGGTIGVYSSDGIVDLAAALEPFGGSRAKYRRFVEEPDPRVRRGQARVRP